jgi:hypothetical protein
MRIPFARTRSARILQISAVLTLAALALMLWSLFQPTPLPVMLAMTAGQGLGTTALALYVFVIVRDLRRDRTRNRRDSLTGMPAIVPTVPLAPSAPAAPATKPEPEPPA